MHVHLLVPDALAPGADIRLPALETLIARGRRERSAPSTLDAWLKHRFALQGQGLAAFALQGDGHEAGHACWMHADPVHLRISHGAPLLADASLFELSAEEATALVAALNGHFAGEPEFVAPRAERWYARIRQVPELQFTPLAEARGQPVSAHLPAGADAMRWHALMNEAQMVLHAHPVNQSREARGASAINSLWFSGGGRLEEVSVHPFDQVLGDVPAALGLAQATGAAGLPLPRDAASWLESAPEAGRTLIILDALRAPKAYGDLSDWQTRLGGLEQAWFTPLLAALRRGRIGMVTVHLTAAQGTLSAETVRTDLHRFWRRSKALSAYPLEAP